MSLGVWDQAGATIDTFVTSQVTRLKESAAKIASYARPDKKLLARSYRRFRMSSELRRLYQFGQGRRGWSYPLIFAVLFVSGNSTGADQSPGSFTLECEMRGISKLMVTTKYRTFYTAENGWQFAASTEAYETHRFRFINGVLATNRGVPTKKEDRGSYFIDVSRCQPTFRGRGDYGANLQIRPGLETYSNESDIRSIICEYRKPSAVASEHWPGSSYDYNCGENNACGEEVRIEAVMEAGDCTKIN